MLMLMLMLMLLLLILIGTTENPKFKTSTRPAARLAH